MFYTALENRCPALNIVGTMDIAIRTREEYPADDRPCTAYLALHCWENIYTFSHCWRPWNTWWCIHSASPLTALPLHPPYK